MDGGLARVEAMLARLDPLAWSRRRSRPRTRTVAAERPQGARPDGRPRVLVEHPDGAVRAVAERVLDAAGYAVESCPGPAQLRGQRCPLVEGEGCPKAARADVVVHGLGLEHRDAREVLECVREYHPWTPVVVDGSAAELQAHAAAVRDCALLPHPWARAELLAAVRAQVEPAPPAR